MSDVNNNDMVGDIPEANQEKGGKGSRKLSWTPRREFGPFHKLEAREGKNHQTKCNNCDKNFNCGVMVGLFIYFVI